MDDIDVHSRAAANRIHSQAAEIDTEDALQRLLRAALGPALPDRETTRWRPTTLVLAAGLAVVASVLAATVLLLDRDSDRPGLSIAPASSPPPVITVTPTAPSLTPHESTVEASSPRTQTVTDDAVQLCPERPRAPEQLPNGERVVGAGEVQPANEVGWVWEWWWSTDPEWYVRALHPDGGAVRDNFTDNDPANLVTTGTIWAAVLPIGDEHVGDTSIEIKDVGRECVYLYVVGPGPSLQQIRVYAAQLRAEYTSIAG